MKLSRVWLPVALLASLLTGCSQNNSQPPAVNGSFPDRAYVAYEGVFQPSGPPDGMNLAAQKGYTALYYNPGNADFALEDMRTGEIYYGIPPKHEENSTQENSHLHIVDLNSDENMQTRYSADANITTKKTDDGFQAWYAFTEEKYAVPVEYSLCEDGLRVRIRCDRIMEKGDYRVFSIAVLPFFHAQSGVSEGFLFVPDGSGAIMRMNRDKSRTSPYSENLYGSDYITGPNYVTSRQENCLLPFTGIQATRGGFFAYAENAAAAGGIFSAAEGQESGYAHTYFKFDLRKKQEAVIGNTESWHARIVYVYEDGPPSIKDISVRYFLLDSAPENGLGKMAEVARNIIAHEAGDIPPAPDNAFYLTTLGGYTAVRPVLGFRTNVTKPVTTFSLAGGMMEELRISGVDKAALIYTGYNRAELRGSISDKPEPDSPIGSIRELSALSKDLGANRLLLTVDPVTFQKSGGGINPNRNATRDITLSMVTLYQYKRNNFLPDKETAYYLLQTDRAADFLRRWEKWIDKEIPQTNLLVTEFGEKLYGNYFGNGYNRLQAAQNIGGVLKEMSGRRPVFVTGANYGAALFSSAIVNAPDSTSGYDALDESVPFYQMVFSGIRQVVSRPINTSGDPDLAFLQSIRSGMIPHYELIAQEQEMPGAEGIDSFYSASFSAWGPEIIKRYRQYLPVYEAIRGRDFIDYRAVGEDVYELTYSGDVRVIVNLSIEKAEWNGREIGEREFLVVNENP